MANDNNKIWMVRAGQGSYLIDEFLQRSCIAIGWREVGDLNENSDMTIHELKDRFKAVYPDDSEGRVRQCVGQIWRFWRSFSIGDKVVTYDAGAREYYLGTITSEYQYDGELGYPHYRSVAWMDMAVDRDLLSTETKNTLGAISTIFELPSEVWGELERGGMSELDTMELAEAEQIIEERDLQRLKDDVIFRSQEFIKDIIANLSWQDTETLIAGLLKAMGYKTRMTAKGGGDLGSDIIASPDDLFLEQPLIKVEVKKRSKDKIQAPDIRNFIGGMRGHHKGIYVTTSSFSKEAQYEAERANFAITLIDSDWLVELLLSNYESLDPEIKALVPLRKIYWPV